MPRAPSTTAPARRPLVRSGSSPVLGAKGPAPRPPPSRIDGLDLAGRRGEAPRLDPSAPKLSASDPASLFGLFTAELRHAKGDLAGLTQVAYDALALDVSRGDAAEARSHVDRLAEALRAAAARTPGPARAEASKLGAALRALDPSLSAALRAALSARGETTLAEAIPRPKGGDRSGRIAIARAPRILAQPKELTSAFSRGAWRVLLVAAQSGRSSEVESAIALAAEALAKLAETKPGPAKAAAPKLASTLAELSPSLAGRLKQALAARGETALAQAIPGPAVDPTAELDAPAPLLAKPPSSPKGLDFLPPLGGKRVEADAFRYARHGAAFDEAALVRTHNRLVQEGFVFLGYRGTTQGFAEAQINRGVAKDRIEYRGLDDPWRGLYLAQDPAVCAGYAGDKRLEDKYVHTMKKNDLAATSGDLEHGVLVRVYAPKRLLDEHRTHRVEDMGKADEVVRGFLREKGFSLPADDRVYRIQGPQGGDDAHGRDEECAISWALAEQCAIVPSLARVDGGRLAEGSLTETERTLDRASDRAVSAKKLTLGDAHAHVDPRRSTRLPPTLKEAEFSVGEERFHPWDPNAYSGEFSRAYPAPLGEARAAQLSVLLGERVDPKTPFGVAATRAFQRFQVEGWNLHGLLDGLAGKSADDPAVRALGERLRAGGKASAIPLAAGGAVQLSGHKSASDPKWLRDHIGFVLNTTEHTFPVPSGVRSAQVCVTDLSVELFAWTSKQIGDAVRAGEPVLVHCIEGRNRSATVLAAYLMQAEGLTAEEAAKKVKDARPWAEPELPFLRRWEDHLAGR